MKEKEMKSTNGLFKDRMKNHRKKEFFILIKMLFVPKILHSQKN